MSFLSEEDAKRFLNGGSSPEDIYNQANEIKRGTEKLLDYMRDVLKSEGFRVGTTSSGEVTALAEIANVQDRSEMFLEAFVQKPPSNLVGVSLLPDEPALSDPIDEVEWRAQTNIDGQEDRFKSAVRTILDENNILPE